MRKIISFACVLALSALTVSNTFAQNESKPVQGIKKLGKTFKEAAVQTYHDASDAVKSETKKGTDKEEAAPAAPTYYVSMHTGSNRNPGTAKDAPLKNLQKALDVAPEGSTILVAEGNYFGTLNSGNINIEKPVSIIGGYNTAFSEKDPLRYRTTVRPDGTSNGTQSGEGTMQVKVRKTGAKVLIDGLLFDRGNSVAYNDNHAGQPEGVECPMMQPIGSEGIGGEKLAEEIRTAETAIIYLDNSDCDLTIRNCSFVNGPYYGIKGMAKGHIEINNNIFVNIRMAAVEIPGGSVLNNAEIHFSYNTVLFVWSRLKDQADMGFGYRFMNGANSYLDHNIFGCAVCSALDRCRVEALKEREAKKVTTSESSIFFLNNMADITLPGGGESLKIRVKDFDDVEQLAKASGNQAVKDPSFFEGKVDAAYLNGFLNTMKTSSGMFANRYPFEKALELFGAIEGCGAQVAM